MSAMYEPPDDRPESVATPITPMPTPYDDEIARLLKIQHPKESDDTLFDIVNNRRIGYREGVAASRARINPVSCEGLGHNPVTPWLRHNGEFYPSWSQTQCLLCDTWFPLAGKGSIGPGVRPENVKEG